MIKLAFFVFITTEDLIFLKTSRSLRKGEIALEEYVDIMEARRRKREQREKEMALESAKIAKENKRITTLAIVITSPWPYSAGIYGLSWVFWLRDTK